jgi:transposase
VDFISGEDREQVILFPASIDEYVEENNPVRVIDAYINSLDLAGLGFDRTSPKETGRPPYDPKDILKLYVYGYMNRIRSSRRLETESKRNLELFWLLRKLSPDHKTISRFRQINFKALKNVFRDFVKLCEKLNLYGKELVAIDGSKFKAVNSKGLNFTKDKLKKRIKRIDENIDEYLKELNKTDMVEDTSEKEKTAQEIKEIINGLEERKELYIGYTKELEESGETQKSLTDSDSRLMLSNGKLDVCYNVQTAVDSKHKLIAEFEVTNEANDLNQLSPMALSAKEILDAQTLSVTADCGYDSARDIAEALQEDIQVHVAGTDYDICIPAAEGEENEITSHRNGKSVYIKERNIAVCPMGKVLFPNYYDKNNGRAAYKNPQACKLCACRCTKQEYGHTYKVTMKAEDFSKEYNAEGVRVRQVHIKPDKDKYAQRKSLSEHPFGTIKRSMDSGYCLLRGKEKVRGEFSLIFLAYNIKRVINIIGSKKLRDFISERACMA